MKFMDSLLDIVSAINRNLSDYVFFFLLAGFTIMDVMRRIKAEKYLAFSRNLFFAALILLWGVLFLGVKINGMRGWYSCYFINLQPSEIFKFIYILHISNIYH